MISSFTIGNFKAFGPAQTIPLKPITLIFGPNSAGKSSIIHGLLLAAHALETGELDVRHLRASGDTVDLGGFRQYAYCRKAANRVQLGFSLPTESLDTRARELLAGTRELTVTAFHGVPVAGGDFPIPGSRPSLVRFDVAADGAPLVELTGSSDGPLRVRQLASSHPVFMRMVEQLIAERSFRQATPESAAEARAVIDHMVTEIQIPQTGWLPRDVSRALLAKSQGAELAPPGAGRGEQLARDLALWFPYRLGGLLDVVRGELERWLGALEYLGPLRSNPMRDFPASDETAPNWTAGGGFAWRVLRDQPAVRDRVNQWLASDFLQSRYEIIVRSLIGADVIERVLGHEFDRVAYETVARVFRSADPRLSNPELLDIVVAEIYDQTGEWPETERIPDLVALLERAGAQPPEFHAQAALGEMQIAEESESDQRQLLLVDQRTRTKVSHRDVGIGISQVLPVLVHAFADTGKLIAIEQPEIHLHPALQSELADVFIESALGERKNTFILETHSEHLILRLLRRVRETAAGELPPGATPLRPEDLAVLYVKPGPEGSEVVALPVNTEGDFDAPWPDGFFAERAKELF